MSVMDPANPANNVTQSGTGQPSLARQKFGNNIDAIANAYDESHREAQNIIAARDEAQQRVEILMALLEKGTNAGQPATPAQPSALASLAEKLDVPLDQLQRAFTEIAVPAVEGVLKPFTNGMSARQIAAAESPGYAADEAAVMQWLSGQPKLNARVQKALNESNAETAAETLKSAHLQWRATRPVTPSNQPTTDPNAELNRRLDAMLPEGHPSRINGATVTPQSELAQLLERGEAMGNLSPFLDKFFEGKIEYPDGIPRK